MAARKGTIRFELGTHVACGGRVFLEIRGKNGWRSCEGCGAPGERHVRLVEELTFDYQLAVLVGTFVCIFAACSNGARGAPDGGAIVDGSHEVVVTVDAGRDTRSAGDVPGEVELEAGRADTEDAAVVDARGSEVPSGECVHPRGWLVSAGLCPNDLSCGVCFESDPNNREAGVGTPISGCVYMFAPDKPVTCVLACSACPIGAER